jgi:hypothetical protein
MFGVQGDLYIARRARPVTTPATLPAEFQQAVESPLAGVRAGAVHELQRLLASRHAGLALAAKQVLEQLTNDDSRTVATAATAALAAPAPTQPAPSPAAAAVTAPTPPAQPAPAAAPQGPAATTPPAEGTAAAPTPTASTGGAHAGSGPEAAVAPTGIDQRPAPRVRTDRRLVAAGGLGIVCAALILLGLFPAYTDGYRLASDYDDIWRAGDNIWYAIIVAGLASTVGICAGAPYMRWLVGPWILLVGPGVLLGTVAASTWVLLLIVIVSLETDLHIGPGFQMWLVAHLLLVLAGGLAWFALAQAGGARLALRFPKSAYSWLVVLLGVVGAVALATGFSA